MEIFPAGAATTVITGALDVIQDNIAVVVGLVGFGLGVKLLTRLFNKSAKGRV